MQFYRSNIHNLLNSEDEHPDFVEVQTSSEQGSEASPIDLTDDVDDNDVHMEGSHSPPSSPETSRSSSAKPKRHRTVFTEKQLKALQLCFGHTPSPTIQQCEDLAVTLGIQYDTVRRWFSRERLKAPRRLLPDGTKLELRKRLTPGQKSRLEHEYELNPHPSGEKREEIALDINLSYLRVSNWYMHMNSSWGRRKKERLAANTSSMR
ncbi:hypothetical protein D9611_014443 [Ephemerocybe angulata]|uniref:Homeobox domain-containing protein n=1 Tax=Ephemerocybe angulata TaxID=980116 RepID=A0A8H5ART2_9AGAR|nr:hypothetical protein D9611_014443 [Tulosesus angulatus]